MSEKIKLNTAIYASVKELEADILVNLPSFDMLSQKYFPTRDMENQLQTDIKNTERKEKRHIYIGKLYKLVSAFAIMFFLGFSPFLTASAVQQAVSETAVKWYNQYITVESNTPNAPKEIKDLKVGYMTEGFVLEEEFFLGESITKDYSDENLYISINARVDNDASLLGLDNERSDFYTIEINENKGLLMNSEDGYNRLVIADNGIRYIISGYTNIDEILKIYKNLEIIL